MRTLAATVAVAAIAALAGAGSPAPAAHARTQAAAPVTIKIVDFGFKPARVVVRVGQQVRFVMVGKIDHTVADTTAKGAILSKQIKPRLLSHGDVQTVTFKRSGTVHYLCTLHPTLMKGVIVVRP
jgi:plastocyanin